MTLQRYHQNKGNNGIPDDIPSAFVHHEDPSFTKAFPLLFLYGRNENHVLMYHSIEIRYQVKYKTNNLAKSNCQRTDKKQNYFSREIS